MALTPLSDDLNIIAALHDEPNVDDGLTAAQLKAKFDESGNKIKTYINGTLKGFVDDLESGTGLADGSVTTAKIAEGSVTSAKIGPKEVKTANIDDLAVTTGQLDNFAVTVAKIANKNVVKAKLDDSLQASIDLANTAYQKPVGGIPKTDLVSVVQASLGKADTAYQKPGTGIPKTDLASAVQASLGKADSAYQKPGTGIPTADIADGAVTTAKLADEAVTNAKLAQNAVNNYNIATGAVSRSNLAEDALEVFWAEYGTTYPVQIAEAVTDGKFPACLYNNHVYVHVKYVPGSPDDRVSKHYFSSLDSDGTMYYLVCEVVSSVLTWSNGSIDLTSGGGGGSSDYDDLTDKPSINSVTLSGNKTTSDLNLDQVFWATYGTTTKNELKDAYDAGKVILCKDDGYIYSMMYRSSATLVRFIAFNNDGSAHFLMCSDGTWTKGTFGLGPSLSDVAAKALGTASAGTSTTASRSDHVHPMPTAAQVGAIAAPSSPSDGQFLVYSSSQSAWVAQTVPTANGVSF